MVKAREKYYANKEKNKHFSLKMSKALSQQKYDPNDPELLRAKAKIEAVQNLIKNGQLTPVPLSKEERKKQKLHFNKSGFWEWI
jgi:hypothetical protein